MTGRGRRTYRASGASDREDFISNETVEQAGDSSDSDPPLSFDSGFAGWAATILVVVGVLLLAPVAYRLYDTDSPDPVDRMAISTSLALLIVGVLVLLSGVYVALLEIRGRFRVRAAGALEARGTLSLRGTVDHLRSPVIALLLAGCVPLIAAAWVAQSGVDDQPEASPAPTTRTRTPSPVPSGTTTTTPTP